MKFRIKPTFSDLGNYTWYHVYVKRWWGWKCIAKYADTRNIAEDFIEEYKKGLDIVN